MARDLPAPLQKLQNPLLQTCFLIIIAVIITADSAKIKNLEGNFAENLVYSNGNTSNWYHCPQGWTLFINRCFKVTEATLTWAQAQALCRSYGGNLVKITSQCEQIWVNQFLKEQLKSVSLDNNKSKISSNVADVPSIEAWIGFTRLTDKTFQWSDGQAGVEQDGFWAVDAFKNLVDKPVSKLCCDIKAQSPNNDDLRWQLALCDELHSSVCELRSCEEHTEHCADGTKCINKSWICDGYWDCQDGSDEKNCLSTLYTTASSHCGTVFKEQIGYFLSPSFPEEYPPFLNCLWKIEATTPQVIELLVISLDTEEKYDTLNIYEGTEVSEQQLIVSLAGKMHNQTVRSQGSFVTVHFVSDYSVQARGFNISWRAGMETKQCGGQLVAGDQESVLSFPQSEYDTSAWSTLEVFICDWLISSFDSTSLLSLQFKNITLVSADSIAVYDGGGIHAPVITHITPSVGALTPSSKQDFSEAAYTYSLNIPPVITSSGQHLLLRVIISRGSLSSFVIAYKNGCDTFISSSSSLILSPGYPKSQYPNNLNCTWTVPRDRLGRHLSLLFLPHFFTESGKDYVQVFISEMEQPVTNVTKMSGLNSNLQPGISSFHGFVINFVTDATVNRGRWAAVISYDCVVLSVLPPLLLNSTDIQFGAAIEYSCMKGFMLVGPTYAVCGWSGQWLPSDLPSCTKINCGIIPVPSGAYLTNTTGLTYGSYAHYKCLYGHTFAGHSQAVCGENGWENVPVCKLITCPKEHPPIGGNARAEDIKAGYLREYFCKPKLQLVGSKFSHCNISGQWTEKVPICEAQKCPNLYGSLNSQRSLTDSVAIGRSIRVTCYNGYKLTGQDELTCMENLQFNYPLPSCIDVNECDSSEICGIHLCQNFIGGYSCFCQAGYKHLGNSSQICNDINECEFNNGGCSHICVNMPGKYKCDCPQSMSLYVGPLDHIHTVSLIPNKTCIASCKPFVAAEGVKILYQQKALCNGEFLYGTKADIICPHGFYTHGASVVSCELGDGWFPSVVNCTELLCEAPRNVNGGTVSYTNITLGSSVSYSCDKNLILEGPRIRFCEKEFNSDFQLVKLSWTEREPACVTVSCPELQSPVHGKVDYSSTYLSSVAVFRCHCGYWLVGQSVVKCMPDGCWSHPSPTCEVQFCLHPGLPPKATMLEYTPGFPVESTVRFQCLNKGYQSSSQDPIKCLAYKQSKVSAMKPSIDLTISGQFVSIDQINLTTVCNSSYKTEELVNKWWQKLVQLCDVLNVEVDVQNDTVSIVAETNLNITVHIFLLSDNASTTCHCCQNILQYFMAALDHVTLGNWDINCPEATLRLNSILTINDHWFCGPGLRLANGNQRCGQETLPSCMEDCIDEGIETLDSEVVTMATTKSTPNKDYKNEKSVSMHSSTVTKSTAETTDKILQDTQQTTREVMSVSESDNKHNTTDDLDTTTTKLPSSTFTTTEPSVLKEKSPTTHSLELLNSKQTTADMWTSTHKSSMKHTGLSNTFSTSTIETPVTNGLNPTTQNLALLNSKQTTIDMTTLSLKNTVQRYLSSSMQTFSTVTPTEPVLTTLSNSEATDQTVLPNSKTTPIPGTNRLTTSISSTTRNNLINDQTFPGSGYQTLKLTSSATFNSQGETNTEYSGTSLPMGKSTTRDRDIQRTTSSPHSTLVNCTAYTEHHARKGNQLVNSSQEKTSSWRGNGGNSWEDSNTTDCMTTHAVEKQTVTLVQGSSVPSHGLLAPVYSVEIYDFMLGGFANISCIDAVHISINAKVIELLREFGQEMGRLVCKDSPDASLELNSGNISFKGTRAKIFIKFYITYSASSKESVISCGMDFQSFATSQLPKKFERVKSEQSVSQCRFLNYTGQGFKITYHGWSCHNGYLLDESLFQCFYSSLLGSLPTDSSTITTTPSPPTPVLTVPHLSIKFVGTFTASSLKDKIDENCVKEYKKALIKVLTALEHNLQTRIFKDIYTNVDNDINVTISDKKVIAEVTVSLLPLQESVDLLSMYKCANFTTLQFREPSQQILSLTVTNVHLLSCPVLVLSAHGFRTDTTKIEIHCSPGYLMNMANFKCIHEILPQYITSIDIATIRASEELVCVNIIQTSAQQLIEDVDAEIHQDISKGNTCNSSEDIIILQKQTDLAEGKQAANISITVMLVNLKGNKSETLDCAEQLYKFFISIISQRVTTMIDSLPQTCQASLTFPQNYTVLNKQWACFQQRVYNALTHQCDGLTTQSPEMQASGQSLFSRQKRSVRQPQFRPQWNGTLPTCIDIEPPTFHSCPERPHIITINQLGPVPIFIPLPNVTDNSGMRPSITVTPDITLPYRFTQNTTIVMIAKDTAGNIAKCIMNVTVTDQTSPRISCPSNLVTIFMKTCQDNPTITYNNAGITASDNNGFVRVVYNPPEGSVVKTSETILVTASAVDGNFNVANCSFLAKVENCPEWSLPLPEGGNKSCVLTGTNNQELSCVVSCPADKGFAVQPPDHYIFRGQWLPHNRVPQCVESRFPDYEVRLKFNLRYQGNTTGDCLNEMLNALIESVKSRLLSVSCWNATQDLNFTQIDSVGTFYKDTLTMMTAKLKISIRWTVYNVAATATAQWCGEAVLHQLELNGTLRGSCGQLKLSSPASSAGKNSCPLGLTYLNGMCYECPAGSYISKSTCKECPKDSHQNNSEIVNCQGLGLDCPQGQYSTEPECLECSMGTYQNTPGSSECLACKPGYSTSDVGTINEKDCLAECKKNYFSFTGVKPCIPCPLGTHQPKSGSKYCDICDFDNDGNSQFPYCKKLCAPGEYSSDGTSPCILCPYNYFNQYNGSNICTECPDNKVTKTVGSISQYQCEAYDPCLDNPCKYGSLCQPYGRYFKCECLPGFTGSTCQDKVEICDSQVCQNNRRCEIDGNVVTCSCPPGLDGITCPEEVTVTDHCLSNPCVYGSCVNTLVAFTCSCYSGFHGERCDMEIDNCADITCNNGGVCVDLVFSFKCLCVEQFTGIYCDVKIGHCQVNYCLNGGTCVGGTESFNCLCPDGFTGDFCEVEKDECTSSPCFNGGLCQDGVNSFKCLCLPEYTGICCDSVWDPCDVQPCLNGAICSKTEDSQLNFSCKCKEGYSGQICEVSIDVCYPMPCNTQGSYSCEKNVSTFNCNCLPGWKGHLCDEKMNLCSSYPCQNGGTCDSSGDAFICTCPPYFTGPTCSVSVNSCQSRPCQNLGSCVDITSGYMCQCLPGFTGLQCELNIDECESSPCLNQSICQDGVNAFTCSCPRGFAGDLCEVNINECLRQPCQHNSTCRQVDSDFLCICAPGFTGKHCEIKINECSSNPCHHQGICVDKVASFHCNCPQGYSGSVCEEIIDECQDHTICLNNATCHNADGKNICQCTPYYTGDDCGKEKTANFDLHFLGSHTLNSQSSTIPTGNLSELSLCLWLKFSKAESKGTYLVLTSEDGLNHFLILRDSQAISSLFASKEIILYINDGHWHHICLVLSMSNWGIFKDGIIFQEGEMEKWIIGNSLMMKLGQPLDYKGNDEWFRGHLHGVNMYSYVLDKERILNMSQNCDLKMPGNIFNWITAESNMFGDVQVSMPSQCGQILCSSGNKSHLCSTLIEGDKTPPENVNCPETIVVTSEKRLVSVTWPEPEFSDNIGIVSVKQNFRSGQIFSHGQYFVTYIAYDAENNSATCSFQIFVRMFNCVDPPPPTNGACICGGWEHGRYCVPSCTRNFHFVSQIPPFYRCGYEGIWDPPSGDKFAFPVCARAHQPAHKMFGSISFDGPECSSTNKLRLKEKLMHIMNKLSNILHLCGTDEVCTYTQDFNIECAVETKRKRRSVSSEGSLYTVGMNIIVPSSLSDKLSDPDSMPDSVVYLMKQDQSESNFVLTSVDLHQTSYCQLGQILTKAGKPQCLNCPVGYFMATESVCSPCPRGSYSDKPQHITCTQCADGLTTSSKGSTSASQCSAICKAGTYFSVSTSGCELCIVGEYQNMVGQWSCMSCPVGLTTRFSGTTSVTDCQDLCGAGQELGINRTCVDCPLGTYSSGKETSLFCTPCPFGWTTEKEKAVDQTQCIIRKCDKGYYHHLEDKVCYPCPQGTFQELRGAASCEPCGVRMTTEQEGAVSRSLCIPGRVNECELKVDSCASGTKCVDLDDGFDCAYICESYCSTLKFCNDGDSVQDKECHCAVEMCKNYNSRDSTYKSLVTASIIVTVFAILVLLAVIIVCVYRKNHQMKQDKHVRMYRDETELASFTNEAFDSFSAHMDLDRDEFSFQMPKKMATRWHNQNFMSKSPLTEDEIESASL